MPIFLFWNVAGKSLDELIAAIAVSNEADVIILAECRSDPNDLTRALNTASPDYQFAPGFCQSLSFFTKFDSSFLSLMAETPRTSIRRLNLPARSELILAAAHLPSKAYFSDDSQIFQCAQLANAIEEEEEKAGHRRTILLGDLNVNPFEIGMVAFGGLHAVSTREIASKGSRVVQSQRRAFFYNPMWKYFGDRSDVSPGTYYYEKAESVNYYWNTFDQILIRPDVLEGFRDDGVRVITHAGERSLIDVHGKPDKKNASDHLPVLLDIHF
jgi:exonuclease III